MSNSIKNLAQMSRLLEEALALDDVGRRRWLDELQADHRQLEQALRRALLIRSGALRGSTLCKPDPTPRILEPGERVGPYRLVRELGAGGMAQVWLARRADGAFQREVALKVPNLSRRRPDKAGRFARECDILAGLEHPNIARLYDAGTTEDGVRYLAMEHVVGEPLIDWCDGRRLGVRDRLMLFLQVLTAVQYAHRRRIIHRDIKPSNILVNDLGEVRLLDFGAAKQLESDSPQTDLTQTYGQALTPDYASPELLRGDGGDATTDVYALGIVLYELLAGSRPYQIEPGAAARWRERVIPATGLQKPSTRLAPDAASARATTQDELARRLKGDLDSIVLKALAAQADDRYDSAAALGHDLRRYLCGEPVHARPDRLPYRVARFVQRHQKAVAVVAALSLLACAAIGYALMRPSGAGQVEAPADSPSVWSQTDQPLRCSAACSSRRALFQSRCTVRSVTPSVSAISASV
jgi:serine/threonine protein kinase